MRNPNENEGNIQRDTAKEMVHTNGEGVTSESVKAEWLTSPKMVKIEPVAVPIEHGDE